ncbi:MAG: dihydrofolate reductase [Candidatus Daviesbacteria bacterium]|nr:dihydrofolate reductase [Candidatus Daviesbacteria bacterium]
MVSIIVAVAGEKRVIGKAGGMSWHIPEELKRFREITMGHPIIMGRKTYESIGKVLPGRVNIVITRDLSYQPEGTIVVHSLEEALQLAEGQPGSEEVFVIGGGEIYKQALPITDKLYLTVIDKEIEGDVFFPDYSDFKKVIWQSPEQESDGFKYKFLELERE